MKLFIKSTALSAVVASLLVTQVAMATNGAWLIGFGAKSRSMGGTGVADNRGGLAAAFNPATMSDSGNRFDIGADIFMPPRVAAQDASPGTLGYTEEESTTNLFFIPNMGGTLDLNDKITVGFAFIGAGLQTEYDQSGTSDSCNKVNQPGGFTGSTGTQYTNCPPTFFNFNNLGGKEVGVELMQMQFLPSLSYKINKQHSVGVTLALAASFFRAEGLEAFETLGYSSGADDFTSGAFEDSYSAGYRLGWMGKFMDEKLRFGVNYSSKVWMSKLDKYKNLFAEQGEFDIPESYAVGVAFDFTPKITATFDVQQINWSGVRSIGNDGPLASDPVNFFPLCQPPRNTNECLLGQDDGLGFGWTDQTIYKVGANWSINDKWSARAGWNYGKSPIKDDQVMFNMLAPATPEHHLTLGVGYEINETFVVDGSFVYAFSNSISGPTAFNPGGGPAAPGSSNASIDMTQLSIGGALGIRF